MVKLKYISPIDTHVHFRWHENDGTYMPFMELAFQDGEDIGAAAMIAQGNTKPPLTRRAPILQYIERAQGYRKNIEFAVHGVLTRDRGQQNEMMDLVEDPTVPVVSAKIFYVETTNTGEIEITDDSETRESWMLGARRRFNGNRTGHFEDSSFFKGKYDPADPSSHSLVQPPEAELVQFEKQWANAYDSGFEGNFIVFHVSNPETPKVLRVLEKRFKPKFKTYLEITPHHALLNTRDYVEHGVHLKINPPIRQPYMQDDLFEEAMRGGFHMIGSDHAPHTPERKSGEKPASGTPCILAIPLLASQLLAAGMKRERLDDLLFHNANRIYFGGKLVPREVTVDYDPERWVERYGHNPFNRLDSLLKSA